ncbi:hypothetical protein PVAP13_4KG066433 [Panicum virgatum]|uniref:Uncharacterized protein n=1 Tax=Panicum virgatum TaxID=38727 RepID=A0A8T0TLF4_PANVG|nr:hypothetical protein PVAP13_4KG066433 [Panicum virgatum]
MPHAHLRRAADLRAAPPSAGAPLLSCWDAIWDRLPLHPSTGRQHPQRHDPRVVVALHPCGIGPAQPSVAAAACASSSSSSAAAMTTDPPPSTGALRLGPLLCERPAAAHVPVLRDLPPPPRPQPRPRPLPLPPPVIPPWPRTRRRHRRRQRPQHCRGLGPAATVGGGVRSGHKLQQRRRGLRPCDSAPVPSASALRCHTSLSSRAYCCCRAL